MRQGLKYDPHQADIWSVGATIWEVVEGDPPFITIEDPSQFGESLPSLSNPAMYSQNLHGFLARCSDVASKRPKASDLLKVHTSLPSYFYRRRATNDDDVDNFCAGRVPTARDRQTYEKCSRYGTRRQETI